jgi:hypothetical protein
MRLLGQIALTLISTWAIPQANAPVHLGVDSAPYERQRLLRTIARIEGFGKPGTIATTHKNPGALRNRLGRYARFKDDATGWRELNRWWDEHRGMPVEEALVIYNGWDYAQFLLYACDLTGLEVVK